MDTFKIKSYSKKELALLYFPDSTPRVAVNHLMALIRRNDMLSDEVFTPRQVQAIVDWIGAP